MAVGITLRGEVLAATFSTWDALVSLAMLLLSMSLGARCQCEGHATTIWTRDSGFVVHRTSMEFPGLICSKHFPAALRTGKPVLEVGNFSMPRCLAFG